MDYDKQQQPSPALDVKKSVPWLIWLIFFSVLNETVFNVATPGIARQFALQPSAISMVLTGFSVVFGVGSVVYGRLADIYSLRRLILIGLSIYSGGSLFGFAAHEWYPAVIAARVVQGAGASSMAGIIMVMVVRYFAPKDRGKMFGIIGSTVAFSEGIGPVVGGFVAGRYHWSLLFLIPVLSLAALPYLLRRLPNEPRKPGKLDIPGALALAGGLACLILFLTYLKWIWLLLGAALLAVFALHIVRTEEPFIEPRLLRNRPFVGGVLAGSVMLAAGMGLIFMIPLMLSHVHHLAADGIG
ncbi:MFS transporter [Paenibacillus doosanensis]|uniref:MFS transporter n=1 Tax=Paenibacillus doosanensis TaxID=1229154 RepID=UPI00217FB9F0|nr:MFS transporter [Paenibacillus doosanensis]MCS7459645.1 MFS transporter [Paenibacillus doosanensis]